MMLTERIWKRIKSEARRNEAEGIRLGHQGSIKVVKGIVLSEDGPLPNEAIEFYARELVRLAIDAGKARNKGC